ncbi:MULTISPECIES: beta-ketoacyl synthase N-terminal-like domain-containing protein [unclassified Streptomyces]|uniref:beta-ketoacyl synthase N-terminal-like domain-containing protein n=1 Tax=unclassified Streptomyces TaxID=2593676 RepID=UPI001CBC0568|nr:MULTISPECIES: beta-ketoacyl synthase N-terminal-like domain-containing protein [unclassified Streptomyces]WPO76618.1 beta-ketoacyl synthase N-terminal-like domain-containing protein [Streptomyces sp. KN37]
MTWDITGLGAVSSVGADARATYDALCAGRDGRGRVRCFDPAAYRAGHAYEIDDRGADGDRPLRATGWLLTAVEQAVADAGLGDDLGDIPVLVGTTLREQRSVELWWRGGPPVPVDELHFGTALRRRFGATTSYTFANACAASLYALGMATDMIALSQADTVVVAGTDSIAESTFAAMDRAQTLVPDAARPFDRAHKGMVMGEGAVAVVLTRAGAGRGSAAARLRAVGLNCDAGHPTAPDPAGIAAGVRDAHRRAGVSPDAIDLVMLHGTGTARNDETEAAVMSEFFADADADRPGPLMTAIKSGVGHTLGGSGLLSLVMAVLSMRHGTVPPVIGLSDPIDEAAGLRLVHGAGAPARIDLAQVNAFGFGGINAVAVVEKA